MDTLLKNISIRGRLAYGAACLENALTTLNINNGILKTKILPLIWEFTTTENFTTWDDKTHRINPICFSGHDNHDNYLFQLYKELPPFITEMISDVIEIGGANLYGGTEHFSPHSMKPLIEVIESCKKHQVPLPDTSYFQKSHFSEEHGWGIPRDKSFLFLDCCA